MSRSTTPRRPRWHPQPPRGLRPRLTREQLLDLGLAHVSNLDAIARGEAGEPMLWDYAGAVLGHRSPASTKRYSHWATARLAAALGTIGRKVA